MQYRTKLIGLFRTVRVVPWSYMFVVSSQGKGIYSWQLHTTERELWPRQTGKIFMILRIILKSLLYEFWKGFTLWYSGAEQGISIRFTLVCCTVLCICIALFAERFCSNDVFVFGLYIPEILKFARKMWTPNFYWKEWEVWTLSLQMPPKASGTTFKSLGLLRHCPKNYSFQYTEHFTSFCLLPKWKNKSISFNDFMVTYLYWICIFINKTKVRLKSLVRPQLVSCIIYSNI